MDDAVAGMTITSGDSNKGSVFMSVAGIIVDCEHFSL